VVLLPAAIAGAEPADGVEGPAALDATFLRKPWLTLSHLAGAFAFAVLAPVQFSRRVRSRYPGYHRLAGRITAVAGAVVGFSALALSLRHPIGGANEAAASMLFGLLFLFALGRGVAHARRGESAAHREWMVRAFAIALAVATVRPIIGVFFATSRLTGLTPQEFFGTALWIGFTMHLIAAEVWVQRTRPAAHPLASQEC
jgi:uncharacterized membrane protein